MTTKPQKDTRSRRSTPKRGRSPVSISAISSPGIFPEYSKNRITEEALKLIELAEASELRQQIDAMFRVTLSAQASVSSNRFGRLGIPATRSTATGAALGDRRKLRPCDYQQGSERHYPQLERRSRANLRLCAGRDHRPAHFNAGRAGAH